MHVLGALAVVVQIVCLVHVFKTGRPYWWFWVILLGSVVGCTVYFIVEILPDLRRSPTVKRFGSDFITAVDPPATCAN